MQVLAFYAYLMREDVGSCPSQWYLRVNESLEQYLLFSFFHPFQENSLSITQLAQQAYDNCHFQVVTYLGT